MHRLLKKQNNGRIFLRNSVEDDLISVSATRVLGNDRVFGWKIARGRGVASPIPHSPSYQHVRRDRAQASPNALDGDAKGERRNRDRTCGYLNEVMTGESFDLKERITADWGNWPRPRRRRDRPSREPSSGTERAAGLWNNSGRLTSHPGHDWCAG